MECSSCKKLICELLTNVTEENIKHILNLNNPFNEYVDSIQPIFICFDYILIKTSLVHVGDFSGSEV